MIRQGTGEALCKALANSTALLYLDISFNSIGNEGAKALGVALLHQLVRFLCIVGLVRFYTSHHIVHSHCESYTYRITVLDLKAALLL